MPAQYITPTDFVVLSDIQLVGQTSSIILDDYSNGIDVSTTATIIKSPLRLVNVTNVDLINIIVHQMGHLTSI